MYKDKARYVVDAFHYIKYISTCIEEIESLKYYLEFNLLTE